MSSRNTQAWDIPPPPTHTPHIPTHTHQCAQVSTSMWLRKPWALHSGPGWKGQFAEQFWEMAAIVSVPDSEVRILSSAALVFCYRDAAF